MGLLYTISNFVCKFNPKQLIGNKQSTIVKITITEFRSMELNIKGD